MMTESSDRHSLSEALPLVSLEPGEVVIAEGPSMGFMYILAEGELAVMKGDIQVASITEPGAVVGEIAALLRLGHTATVKAVGPARVFKIEAAESFLKHHPDVLFTVARLLARRLVDATTYLTDVKRQYADRDDHLGMVDEVLSALVNQNKADLKVVPRPKRADPRL
jgi:CRP-like cAMP-binding protein